MLQGLEGALAANDTEAARMWERRLIAGNDDADTLLRAGALLAGHDLLSDAAAVFEECSRRFPTRFEAKYNLVLARVGLGEYVAAEKTLDSVSPLPGQETSAIQYLRGKIDYATDRKQEARQNFENAYRSSPDNENYALDLGLFYIRSSAYVPAVQMLQSSVAQHPRSEDLALELALADALAGQQADALSVSHALVARNPDLSIPRVIAAFASCMSANYRACEAEARAGLSTPHPEPYLHYLLAEALWNSGSAGHTYIQDELSKAIEEMPGCGVCHLLRSRVREAEGNGQAAIADLKAALQEDRQLAPAWYRLSVLYRKSGMSKEADDAIRHYRALLTQQANDEIESFRKQLLNSLNGQASQ